MASGSSSYERSELEMRRPDAAERNREQRNRETCVDGAQHKYKNKKASVFLQRLFDFKIGILGDT